MSNPKPRFRKTFLALVAAALGAPAIALAQTDIASEPLAQPASNVKPNIVVILDDSGSMRQQYTPDYLGSLFGSAEELCFDARDSGGSIDNGLDDCEVGDPPMMASEVNSQYYNPEIRYYPAVNWDTSSKGDMDAAATSNWTAVPTDNVTTPGNNTFRVGLLAMNNGGNSQTTTNLITGFPDRAWCTSKNDDENNAANYPSKCRLNSQYTYPNDAYGYGRDNGGGNNIKHVYGAPYYYRLLPTWFCTDATLTNCMPMTTATGIYTVPAPLRFCSDLPPANCQSKLSGSYTRPQYTGQYLGTPATPTLATATITVRNPQADSFSGSITAININGTNVIAAPVNAAGPISPNAAADAIRTAINGGGSGYTATRSNNVVTITPPTAGCTTGAPPFDQCSVPNGYVVNVTSPGTPVTPATASFSFSSVGNGDRVFSVTVGTTQVVSSTIVCTWGGGCTGGGGSRNDWMGNAVASAINAGTGTHGYTASTTSNGSTVHITAPAGTGGELNGLPVEVSEQGISNINNVTLSGGATNGDIETTATNFSGGVDGALAGRNGVGNFVRVNIVPFVGASAAESYVQPFGNLPDMSYEVKSGQSWGQTFRHDSTGATYPLDRVLLVLYRDAGATPGQTLTVSVRNSWNGTVLGSGTVSSDTLGTSEAWVTVNFAATATLNDNQTYYIQVDSNGPDKVYVGVHDSGSYGNGDLLDNGGSAQGGKDMVFQVSGGIPSTFTKYPSRTDCATNVCSYDEEMTNFANWYAYYRSRMQSTKTAIGRAFAGIDQSYRLGFITINPAGNLSDRFLAVADFDATQKQAWYQKLYDQEDHGSTPLREALSRVGRYYGGVTNGINSGMPGSPIQVSCQPSYAILTTDGYWNGNNGDTLTGGNIGNEDNVDAGYTKRADGAYDGNLSGASSTLADVAAYFYKTDLRTDLADNSPTTQQDQAAHQHMTTFTVGLGLAGLLNFDPNYDTKTSGDFWDIKQGTKDWPVPSSGDETALDDLWHAAVNGRGKFFSARDPIQLSTGLAETLAAVQSRTGAGAAAATSNLQPVAGDNFAFTAQYQTVQWTGDLKARTIDLSTGIVASAELWSAAYLLDQRNHTDRRIYAFDATDTTPGPGNGNLLKALCWPGASATTLYPGCDGEDELTAAEMNAFDPSLLAQYPPWTVDGSGRDISASPQKLLDFVRGDTGNESQGGTATTDLFRKRFSLLGDIVNAQPAYVKGSPFNYNTGLFAGTDPYYQEYRQSTDGTTGTRKGTVYIAANDGMLHAFETDPDNNPYYQTAGIASVVTSDDAFTGTLNTNPVNGEGAERWAYSPTHVRSKLKLLAETTALFVHQYNVDGSPVVGDVCFGHSTAAPCASQANWHTIMVAGLNAGGRGYYALDITDPDNPKGLWEFVGGADAGANCGMTDVGAIGKSSDCNVGLSFGNPLIVKRKSDGKWVVIFTSGYNNVNPGDGKGYLYIVDAQTGVILNRIGTGAGCDGVDTTPPCVGGTVDPSGLGKINAWVDSASFDNTALTVYGGDLLGNLWRFELDPTEPGYLSAYNMVTLTDGSNPQPVTTKPELGLVQNYRTVFMTTGKLLGASDKATTGTQSVYAIRDDRTTNPIGLRSGDLIQQTLSMLSASARTATNNAVDFNFNKGWYVDLPDTGERGNVDPILQLGTLVVPTNVPSDDACVAGGYGWVNFFDFRTGSFVPGASLNTASNKIAASLVVGINVVQLPGGTVKTIVTTADNQQLTQETPLAPPSIQGKRVSWRELAQ